MYSVLIVEDKMLVRLGLKNSIQWDKFNMKVIADAADGQTAISIYENEKPDIVITDIKMPIMGGIKISFKIPFVKKTAGRPRANMGKDSVFWDSLEFWYKARKAGIVDPDSFTQKNDAFTAKSKNGQLLTVYGNWQAKSANRELQKLNPNAAFEPRSHITDRTG